MKKLDSIVSVLAEQTKIPKRGAVEKYYIEKTGT